MRSLDDLAAKKQLLIAQAEFDRIKFALAIHDLKRTIRSPVAAGHRGTAHSMAARLIGFALPALGRSRAGVVLRAGSIALAVYRFLRGFRGAGQA
ncbi:MAG: hypothetical protein H7Z39_07315 [Burkholderiaceae bacterium]|nr:hypothetical protein [Burkholderiaceae bacterium]